ncbi:hypothetical protein [Marinobacter xestospongiae]|uniref:Uncharacterized protein n=1 Tax=Marinobacter xestospongiae TaxID=994319 RepID=A0ABU3W1J5_9GAMM|nr:hypothetical protein [Marinobacter xestospongiae]MDV2080281.1 hypothetical protein [Marinobacter xestospongiae]
MSPGTDGDRPGARCRPTGPFTDPEVTVMHSSENALTNHEVTICLAGGAVLGPFNATWTRDAGGDVRELVREYDAFLQGEPQKRFKFHLHDSYTNTVHTVILNFQQVTGICDHVRLRANGG